MTLHSRLCVYDTERSQSSVRPVFFSSSADHRERHDCCHSNFSAGSSGEPDGLRPHHLLDVINNNETSQALTSAVTALISRLLEGLCPSAVTNILFGGTLFAWQKKSDGVRPIAIGYTWRRHEAKCANTLTHYKKKISDTFTPLQLGVGIRGGCEAAGVHAARRYRAIMLHKCFQLPMQRGNVQDCRHRVARAVKIPLHML